MRIMIVTDQYPPMVGGVPTVTHGLATAFAERGHMVSVVAPSYGARDSRRLEENVRVYRFSSFEWPTYKDLRIPFLPFVPLRNLIKRLDPDIIHVHSPIVLGNIAQILSGGLRKPVVVTNHYLPINMSRNLTDDSLFGKQVSNITYSYLVHFCNCCEYVTAPTQTALNLLYKHGLRAPARVLSNGINLRIFSPGERDEQVLRRFELPINRPLAIHVNRLSEEKRVNVLLDATAKMQSDTHIVLVGTGPATEELREQTRNLGLEKRVSFLGFVRDEDLLALRRSSDFFVIPSVADLQSLSTMEAMACGLPVIAANAYALPELAHHNENGFLFQPGNTDELAHYMDLLASDRELRSRMGTASLRIIANHDCTKVLAEWEGIYQRLAIEFQERKQRRLQLRIARKNPGYATQHGSARKKLLHIRRTGGVGSGQPDASDVP
jgi:phosphatidylinositol alpha 1,6-mannosyltransferase